MTFENETGATEHSEAPAGRWHSLKERTGSALVMGVVAVACLLLGGFFFSALIILMAVLMAKEWPGIMPQDTLGWRIGGYVYAIVPAASAIALRNYPVPLEHGALYATLAAVLMVCATDIGAFFAGRFIGGPKLAPRISPNKTWAGLGGGMLASIILSLLFLPHVIFPLSVLGAIVLGAAMAVLAQAGDLFESWMKRQRGVKDSGSLLPGHGGALDRMDGYVLTLPFYLLLLSFAPAVA